MIDQKEASLAPLSYRSRISTRACDDTKFMDHVPTIYTSPSLRHTTQRSSRHSRSQEGVDRKGDRSCMFIDLQW